MKINWPDEIPMPKIGQFNIGAYHDAVRTADIVRSCLLGWTHRAFDWRDFDCGREFRRALVRAVRRRFHNDVADFNDHPDTTDADRQSVWDEAAAEFGYERTEEPWSP